ncbi:hypothetical protein DMI70_07765 [Escherichia coli]|nr:hypothetical protein [Escherichia coli]
MLWINIFSSVLLVPVYEEIVFRGCLLTLLNPRFNDNICISAIVTSVIFLHYIYNILTFVHFDALSGIVSSY